jgi:hypothetical protein
MLGADLLHLPKAENLVESNRFPSGACGCVRSGIFEQG